MNNPINIVTGAHGIQSVYKRLLKGKKADFVCLSTNYESVIGEWYDNEFEGKLFSSAIKTREVVADTAGNRSYGQKKDGVKNQARYLTSVAETDLIIGDEFMAIVCFDVKSPYALVIEDRSVIDSAQVWFDAIWASAAR